MPGRPVEIIGLDRLERFLTRAPALVDKAVAAGLYAAANEAFRISQRLVPVRWGILKGSGHVTIPKKTGLEWEVIIGYGGAASEYSIYVHERLDLRHRSPTQAKFLEEPVRETIPFIPVYIESVVVAALRGA